MGIFKVMVLRLLDRKCIGMNNTRVMIKSFTYLFGPDLMWLRLPDLQQMKPGASFEHDKLETGKCSKLILLLFLFWCGKMNMFSTPKQKPCSRHPETSRTLTWVLCTESRSKDIWVMKDGLALATYMLLFCKCLWTARICFAKLKSKTVQTRGRDYKMAFEPARCSSNEQLIWSSSTFNTAPFHEISKSRSDGSTEGGSIDHIGMSVCFGRKRINMATMTLTAILIMLRIITMLDNRMILKVPKLHKSCVILLFMSDNFSMTNSSGWLVSLWMTNTGPYFQFTTISQNEWDIHLKNYAHARLAY